MIDLYSLSKNKFFLAQYIIRNNLKFEARLINRNSRKRLSYREFPNNSAIFASTNLLTLASIIEDKSNFHSKASKAALEIDSSYLSKCSFIRRHFFVFLFILYNTRF